MSATIYNKENYDGDSHTLNTGSYNSTYFKNIDYANFEHPESIKVDRNTIVHLSTTSHPTGFGDNRIIIGPQNIPSLRSLGFNGKVSSVKILRFRANNWGSPAKVTVFNNYDMMGKYKILREGEYSSERIASKENNVSGIRDGDIRSLVVDKGTVAILYDGENFEEDMNTIFVQGPASIHSLDKYGMDGKLSSIKVFAIDEPPQNLPPNQQKNFYNNYGLRNNFNRKTNFARDDYFNQNNICVAKVHESKFNTFLWILIILLIYILVVYGKQIYTKVYNMFHETPTKE